MGLNAQGLPVLYDRRTKTWSAPIPGEGAKRDLAVGCDGVVWAVTAEGLVQRQEVEGGERTWVTMGKRADFTRIAPGQGTDAWAIDSAGIAHYFLETTRDWFASGKVLADVSVGCQGEVWGVTPTRDLEHYAEGDWVARSTGVAQVVVRDSVYVRTQGDNRLYMLHSPSRTTPKSDWFDFDRPFVHFAAGKDGTLWGVDDKGLPWEHRGENLEAQMNESARLELGMKQGGTWSVVPGSSGIKHVSTGMLGELYGVTAEGGVVRFDRDRPETWEVIPSPENVVRVGSGCDGLSLWAVTADSLVHRYNGNGRWTKFNEKLDSVSLGLDENAVYGIKADTRNLLLFNVKDNR